MNNFQELTLKEMNTIKGGTDIWEFTNDVISNRECDIKTAFLCKSEAKA